MFLNSTNPGYLYQIALQPIDSDSKEKILHLFLTAPSSVNPLKNRRFKTVLKEAELVVFDTPPKDEQKDSMDTFCRLLEKNYDKQALKRINDSLTKRMKSQDIDLTFIDNRVEGDAKKFSTAIAVKTLIALSKNLDLKNQSKEPLSDPKASIQQFAMEHGKQVEYLVEQNQKTLFSQNFWDAGSPEKIETPQLNFDTKIEYFENSLAIAERIHKYLLSEKKTLLIFNESPDTISEVNLFLRYFYKIETRGPIREPIGCFWKIKKENNTVGYLLGSIHRTPNYLLHLNSRIREAFKRSARLAVEIDVTKQKRTNYGTSKIKNMPAEQRDRLYHHLKELFPKAAERIDFQKNVFIEQSLLKLRARIFAENGLLSGMDYNLIQKATKHGKPIEALETLEQYFTQKMTQKMLAEDPIGNKIINALSNELPQDGDISQAVELLIEQISLYLKIDLQPKFDAWERGDVDEFSPAKPKEKTMWERNRNMASKIAELVKEDGKIFCCVGAGHTSGAKSVQSFLQGLGFSTQRITETPSQSRPYPF